MNVVIAQFKIKTVEEVLAAGRMSECLPEAEPLLLWVEEKNLQLLLLLLRRKKDKKEETAEESEDDKTGFGLFD